MFGRPNSILASRVLRPGALVGLGFAPLLAALVACERPPTDGSASSDEALTSSWFAQNLPPGSPLERAVLALVNDNSMSAKEYVQICKFSQAQASAIENYREGDEPADTSDDQIFDTIAELDALPYTNSVFFKAAMTCAERYLPGRATSVCATGTSTVKQAPLALEFVLDASGSMADAGKWTAATRALRDVFAAQAARSDATTAVGLLTFDDWTRVAPAPVDEPQRAALVGAIAAAAPPGHNTPILEALRRAYADVAPAAGTHAVVLLTDGVPSGGAAERADVLSFVQANRNVQLFAVGIGPVPSPDTNLYDPKFLGALAVAADTRVTPACNPDETRYASKMCHFQVTPSKTAAGAGLQAALLKSIDAIRTNITSCNIGLQRVGVDPIDTSRVTVTLSTGEVVPSSATNGWSFDDAAAPTAVLLRGSYCDALRADPKKQARVEARCADHPCVASACTTPPPATCVSATTLRHYSSTGTCETGACAYAPTDESCPAGCDAGACKATPIDACNTLPTGLVTPDVTSFGRDATSSLVNATGSFDFDGHGNAVLSELRGIFSFSAAGQIVTRRMSNNVTSLEPLITSLFLDPAGGKALVSVTRTAYEWTIAPDTWTPIAKIGVDDYTTGTMARDTAGRLWYVNDSYRLVRRDVDGTVHDITRFPRSVTTLLFDEKRHLVYAGLSEGPGASPSIVATSVFDAFPTTTTVMTNDTQGRPQGLSMDACGNLYMAAPYALYRLPLTAAGTGTTSPPALIARLPNTVGPLGRFGRGAGFDPNSIYWASQYALFRVPVGVRGMAGL